MMEDICLRYPHIFEMILTNLDVQSLVNFRLVSKTIHLVGFLFKFSRLKKLQMKRNYVLRKLELENLKTLVKSQSM